MRPYLLILLPSLALSSACSARTDAAEMCEVDCGELRCVGATTCLEEVTQIDRSTLTLATPDEAIELPFGVRAILRHEIEYDDMFQGCAWPPPALSHAIFVDLIRVDAEPESLFVHYAEGDSIYLGDAFLGVSPNRPNQLVVYWHEEGDRLARVLHLHDDQPREIR